MRGKAEMGAIVPFRVGITPAYAGKSQTGEKIMGLGEDHPRICGEKFAILRPLPALWGSPPHMRGKVQKSYERGGESGITPAYAGKRCRCLQ